MELFVSLYLISRPYEKKQGVCILYDTIYITENNLHMRPL